MLTKKKTVRSIESSEAFPVAAATEKSTANPRGKFDIASELVRARTRAVLSQSQLAEKSGAARLYADQGIDAQTLLGHKSPDMTASVNFSQPGPDLVPIC